MIYYGQIFTGGSIKKSHAILIALGVTILFGGCHPGHSEETDSRVIALGHRLVSVDAEMLPAPKPYSESGVQDLVYLSPGLANRLSSLKGEFRAGYEMELRRKDSDGFLNYSYDRQLEKHMYSGLTHSLSYIVQERSMLTLRLRYDNERNKFHIAGFYSGGN